MFVYISRRTLMGGGCTALTRWPRWRWCVIRWWTAGCAGRVTTLIASIAIHGSVARSGSRKGVLRIGRTCQRSKFRICKASLTMRKEACLQIDCVYKIYNLYPAMVRKQFPWILSSSSPLPLDWWWAADRHRRDRSDTRTPVDASCNACATCKQRYCSRRCPKDQLYPSMFCFSLPTGENHRTCPSLRSRRGDFTSNLTHRQKIWHVQIK